MQGEDNRGDNLATPFCVAAQFTGPAAEQRARAAYMKAKCALIPLPRSVLEVYNLCVSGDWLVAVVGEQVPAKMARRLERYLATGELIELQDNVVKALQERRKETCRIASWLGESHRHRRRK